MTSLTKIELENVNCYVIKTSNTTTETDETKIKLNKSNSNNKTTEETVIDNNKFILLTKENNPQNSSDKGFYKHSLYLIIFFLLCTVI